MRTEDIEPEFEKRTKIIGKIFGQVRKQTPEDNSVVKEQIESNYSNIRALYGRCYEIDDAFLRCVSSINEYCSGDASILDEGKNEFKAIMRDMFKSIFTRERANAIVNILKQKNDRVYKKEGIESLRFEKDEILKGFKDETLETDGINELKVKMLFWINKYVKLMDLKMIDKLKSKPMSVNIEGNYFNAKKRLEILKQINEEFDPDTANKFRENFEDEYFEKFGVSIKDDMESLKDLYKTRDYMYRFKNAMMASMMTDYFIKLKKGQDLSGIQAMGITKNEVGLSDSHGSYMAVIRLKGYTSNIYLHTPSYCYAEAVSAARANGVEMLIPNSVYSEVDPTKIIPVNVICKVDKDSERYKKIREEQKEKPKNEALKQAELQVRLAKLKPQQKSSWKHERTEVIPCG